MLIASAPPKYPGKPWQNGLAELVGSVTGPGNVNCAQMLAWLAYQQYVSGNANALNSGDPVFAANPYLDGFLYDNQENGVGSGSMGIASLYNASETVFLTAIGV